MMNQIRSVPAVTTAEVAVESPPIDPDTNSHSESTQSEHSESKLVPAVVAIIMEPIIESPLVVVDISNDSNKEDEDEAAS